MLNIKKTAIVMVFILLVQCMGFTSYAANSVLEVHVSITGNDENDGTSAENAVATLEAAKVLAEKYYKVYGSAMPVHILVHGGEYQFQKSVTFTNFVFADKGKKGLKIMAYGDGEVVFTGASELDAEKLTLVEDVRELARLAPNGRGKVYKMNLYNCDFSVDDTSYPFVYLNGKEQIQSRWPNSGYAAVESLIATNIIGFSDENICRWKDTKDARINAFFQADYFFGNGKIASVDAENKTITLDESGKVFSSTDRVGAMWYARNLLEEVDMPGEWYVDREKDILYFYPPYEIKDEKLEIVTFQNDAMINIGSCKNIEISGITFEKSGGEAIKGNGAENITITGCTFNYLQGRYAVNFSGVNKNITVSDNECYGCHGGFVLCRAGEVNTLESGNTVIRNNHISSCGIEPVNTYAAICGSTGIAYERAASVGTVIENNLIENCVTTYAILVPGCNIKILNNEIVNQSKHLKDAGAIYFGRSHTLRGSEVAYNYLHDFNEENYIAGLYNDDSYSGISWHHNICTNMHTPSIHGIGMDEKYIYNIAINCIMPNTVGSRTGWGNGLYDVNGALYNEMKTVLDNYSDVYLTSFPEMEDALERTPYYAPYNSVFFGNVGINTGNRTIEMQRNSYADVTVLDEIEEYGAKAIVRNGTSETITGKNATLEGNPHFSYSDDYFVDAVNQNYTVKAESELAEAMPEILEIDMESIGLTKIPAKSENSFVIKEIDSGTNDAWIYWDSAFDATKYLVTVATDENMNNVIFEDTVFENGSNNGLYVDCLNGDTLYYVTVKAIGLARQNQFENEVKTNFKTLSENEISKENLLLAINSLKAFYEEISNSSDYDVDEEYLIRLNKEIDLAENAYNLSNTQEEIDDEEAAIYGLADEADLYVEEIQIRRISACFLSDSSTMVHVVGKGFDSGEEVSILVTNPDKTLEGFANDRNIGNVRYVDTCYADGYGKVEFDFDTSKNQIDMPGEYNVYMNSKDGAVLEGKYIYGTVEMGNVSIIDGNGIAITPEKIKETCGETVTINIPVNNRVNTDLKCKMIICYYNSGRLTGATNQNVIIKGNCSSNISCEHIIPKSEITQMKIILVNDFEFLKPMTTSKIIYDVNHKE